jgi:glutamate racemase
VKKLIDTSVDPSCGWCFYVMKTRYTVTANIYKDLLSNIKRHLNVNKIPIPHNLHEIIQTQIALKIDPKFSEDL